MMEMKDNKQDEAFLIQYDQLARGAKLRFVNGVGIYSLPALERLPGFDHGFSARGGGVSEDFPLAYSYANQRTLRLADGPDEVHRQSIAKLELAKYMVKKADVEMPVTRGC